MRKPYTQEQMATLTAEQLEADIQEVLFEFFRQKDEALQRVPQTEEGMAEIVAVISGIFPPAPEYVYEVAVEPQTVEDRQARRAPRITIRMKEQK